MTCIWLFNRQWYGNIFNAHLCCQSCPKHTKKCWSTLQQLHKLLHTQIYKSMTKGSERGMNCKIDVYFHNKSSRKKAFKHVNNGDWTHFILCHLHNTALSQILVLLHFFCSSLTSAQIKKQTNNPPLKKKFNCHHSYHWAFLGLIFFLVGDESAVVSSW